MLYPPHAAFTEQFTQVQDSFSMQSVCAGNQDVKKHVPVAISWWSSTFAFLMPIINYLVGLCVCVQRRVTVCGPACECNVCLV